MSVTAKLIENYQVSISSDGHQWVSDEPLTIGGDDQGPNPFALLMGGLAACKIITAQMYAKRKGWVIDDIVIELSHNKVLGKDCADCVSEGNETVDIIESKMSFSGDLTAEQIKRLGEIADRCPVHRLLTRETVIRSAVI